MKCVALLVFVIFVQLLINWDDDPFTSTDSDDTKSKDDLADRTAAYEQFRSKLNNTHGIMIPNDLLLTVPLNEVSANLVKFFRSFQRTLNDLSDCKSKLVSSVAASLFKLLDDSAKNVGSLSDDCASLSIYVPAAFLSITNALTDLNVGANFSDGADQVKENLLAVIKVLDEVESAESNITKKLNDAVFSLALSVQVMIISTGLIAESAAAKMATIAAEAKDAVISLALILQAIVVVVQSVSSSIASMVLSSTSLDIPTTSSAINSFVLIIDRTLPSITNVLSTITSSSVVASASLIVGNLYVTLMSLITRLNDSITKLQASVVLEVSNKLERILFNLIGTEADFVSYVTTSIATISSSIVVISASDAGIHSKIARQLQTVFQTLLPLTGSESDIAVTLTNSLSTLLDVFKAATNHLTYTIGSELSNAFSQSIEDIFAAIQKMAKMVAGVNKINDTVMDETAVECAKSVQVFGSVVIALTETISGSIGSVNAATLEAMIALPIIHSSVLYVVEWVTIVASSILAKKGSSSELVPSLAVTIVVILKHDSSIVELIAATITRNVSDVVSIITSTVGELSQSNSQLTSLSKVTAKTSVKIEQMSTGGSDVTVNGIEKTTEGNLSQILSGLTGPLSLISLALSSSLNSLKNNFKQITVSQLEILRAVSVASLSIATDLNDIAGSATDILDLTSNVLNSIFGRLLEAISKLSKLGELVTSLATSIGNISTSLHSLIYAIINFKATACFLIDSFRELAKYIQIIMSTFSAIITSAANADSDVLSNVSAEIAALPYVISTIILSIQQVVGAAIPTVSLTTGTIHSIQYDFTIAMSSILEKLTSITDKTTTTVIGGSIEKVPSNILSYVSDLNNFTADTLSKISGVLANIQVTLGLANP